MFATLFTLALFATSALNVLADDVSIDTPSTVKQCTPITINHQATKGPYNVIVVSPTDPCNDILADLGDHDGKSFSWTPKFAAGTKVQLSIQDANEDEGWTGTITIADGPDDCLSTKNTKTTKTTATGTKTGSTTTSSDAGETSAPAPVGAAGNNPFGGDDDSAAISTHISLPLLAISGLVAAVTLL